MASTLTQRNAEISLKALEAGRRRLYPEAVIRRRLGGSDDFRRELLAKVKALARGAAMRPAERPATTQPRQRKATARTGVGAPDRAAHAQARRPEVIAIGSSTGGPQALFTLLRRLPADGATCRS